MSSEIERQILSADERRCRAMVEADYAALDDLLGDDLVYVGEDFGRENKMEHIARMRFGGVRYRAVQRRFGIIRLYGGTAVMHGEVGIRMTCNGVERTLEETFQNVWVKRRAGWQMVAWASTRTPPPP